ncbi:hypothetical protein BCT30_22475 [Enterovibrio norvegicus]|uniref:DUF416 domain-containing protein n=1 Tax=Enterovibrio norvegicus DSM 15893 TaxID=1121869 RepID=A0A1I5ULH8_9GAMM|nr:DUF416 family protein [Enterovibrio norvegicus]MCC4798820.1 DUF416 family protein [Enterovibrio norvegicus]OEE46400.1 hypothetical protein A1OS_08850 [Enterovibrio norvegicus]PMI28176.1 hypothetical protein BCU47_21830 [Enterovibrio norvegicus]PMI35043.1 hypothetical protein BCU46_19790 [Enterovibrio norvegicus]PMN46285.1 hypothetical protein BCT30_22475 [Enterovibrio norvegicus]
MLQNPIQLRLEKLEPWQHITFMAALVERMYPNYAAFCQQTDFAEPQAFRNLLDAVWEIMTVKTAKINFENQLEKLEELIPNTEDYDIYMIYPAVDACISMSTLLHTLLDRDLMMESVLKISQQSVASVAQLEEAQTGVEVTNENQKENEAVCAEWDVQWEIFRALKDAESRDIELIRGIRNELREDGVSNLGLSL